MEANGLKCTVNEQQPKMSTATSNNVTNKLQKDDEEIDIVDDMELDIIDGFQFLSFTTFDEMMREEEKHKREKAVFMKQGQLNNIENSKKTKIRPKSLSRDSIPKAWTNLSATNLENLLQGPIVKEPARTLLPNKPNPVKKYCKKRLEISETNVDCLTNEIDYHKVNELHSAHNDNGVSQNSETLNGFTKCQNILLLEEREEMDEYDIEISLVRDQQQHSCTEVISPDLKKGGSEKSPNSELDTITNIETNGNGTNSSIGVESKLADISKTKNDFDFDTEDDRMLSTPRGKLQFTSPNKELRGSARKKTANLSSILSNMKRHKRLGEIEHNKEAAAATLSHSDSQDEGSVAVAIDNCTNTHKVHEISQNGGNVHDIAYSQNNSTLEEVDKDACDVLDENCKVNVNSLTTSDAKKKRQDINELHSKDIEPTGQQNTEDLKNNVDHATNEIDDPQGNQLNIKEIELSVATSINVKKEKKRIDDLMFDARSFMGIKFEKLKAEIQSQQLRDNTSNRRSERLAMSSMRRQQDQLARTNATKYKLRIGTFEHAIKLPKIRYMKNWKPCMKGKQLFIEGDLCNDQGKAICQSRGRYLSSKMIIRKTHNQFHSKTSLYELKEKMIAGDLPSFVSDAFANGIPLCWKVFKKTWHKFTKERIIQAGVLKLVMLKRIVDINCELTFNKDTTTDEKSSWENEGLRKIIEKKYK